MVYGTLSVNNMHTSCLSYSSAMIILNFLVLILLSVVTNHMYLVGEVEKQISNVA